ncbi:MAG: YggT family protein [Myxococcota bacterium]
MQMIILTLFQVISFVIIIDAVLSWIQPPSSFPRSLTSSMTAPLYAPIHAVIKPQATGGIDFAPVIVLVALQFLGNAIAGLL